MVCAGKPASGSDSGTTAACNGDSGGPLIVNNRIIGVVSWGVTNCVAKGAYSVFTKVSTYIGAVSPCLDDDTNLNGDHKADLFARRASDGTGYELDSAGSAFAARKSLGSFKGVNAVLQTDLDRDGYQDFILRQASTDDICWSHYIRSTDSTSVDKIFTGWKTRTRVVAPGDVTGDGLPDLLSVDSGGTLWIYPGKGNGSFSARVKVGTGWNQYNSLRGHGDLTGDGKADFLARTPGGTLYLYPGTGKAASEIFATRVKIGTGFQQYDTFG
jgi:hypothetical protein